MNRTTLALFLVAISSACNARTHSALAIAPLVVAPTAAPVPSMTPPSTPAPTPASAPLVASATCLPIDASLAPLEAVLQVADPSQMPPNLIVTFAPYSYVASLPAWEASYPAGSVSRAALLAHERVHAVRQLANADWFTRYENDSAFRLAEEEAGYSVQIMMLVRAYGTVDVDGFVAVMTDPYYRGMISATDARAWILAAIAGARP